MVYTLEMNFLTDLRKTLRIAVNDANPTASSTDVKFFMNLIREKGLSQLISSTSGYPVELKSASLIAKNVTKYNLT